MKRKRLISAVIAAAFVLFVPLISSAQVFTIEGNNFRDANGDLIVGIWGDAMPIVDYETGDEIYVPLSNGLWLLAAAAGLYLLAKKKNSRKAAMVLAAATVLTLGTTQCNKPKDEESPAGKAIFISLTADNGQAKSDINMYNGRITWENGDEVYVVYDGQLLSETPLKATVIAEDPRRAHIEGEIVPDLSIGDNPKLTFYYVGSNVIFEPVVSSEEFKFDIKDQDGINAGDYMIGRTDKVLMKIEDGKYVPDTDEDKSFRPLTAVLRLDVSKLGASADNVEISGTNVKNTMHVNLSDGNLSYDEGTVTFKGSADARVSFFETEVNNEESNGVKLDFRNTNTSRMGSVEIKSANGIERGKIYVKVANYDWSYPIPVEPSSSYVDTDADPFYENEWVSMSGEISVSATEKVRLAGGNLQYNKSTDTWRFAENSYDFIGDGGRHLGNVEGSDNTKIADEDYKGWIDLFGWGTSNHDYGVQFYHACDYKADPSSGYGPTSGNLSVEGQSDWACNTILANGVETYGWRTLTLTEWQYIFKWNNYGRQHCSTINGTENCRYTVVYIKVDDSHKYYGCIVFPDSFTWTDEMGTPPTYFNEDCSRYLNHKYPEFTPSELAAMEEAGVAFLPVTGKRSQQTFPEFSTTTGNYWTSTTGNSSGRAKYLILNGGAIDQDDDNNDGRFMGRAVRLAMPVKPESN